MGSFGIFLSASNLRADGGHAGFLSASAVARVPEAGGSGQAMRLERNGILR